MQSSLVFWWIHFFKQHVFHYIPIYVLPVHNYFWEARNIQARNWLMFSACCLWRHVIKISSSSGSRITLCFISHIIDCRVMALWMNEWMMHINRALLCIAVHPKRFTIMWGGLLLILLCIAYEQTSQASDCVFVQFWWMWMLTNGGFLLCCDLLIEKPWFMRSNWHSETKESEN